MAAVVHNARLAVWFPFGLSCLAVARGPAPVRSSSNANADPPWYAPQADVAPAPAPALEVLHLPPHFARPVGTGAALDLGSPAGWSPGCLARKPCWRAARELPACDGGIDARWWSDIAGVAEEKAGETVRVRGRLGVIGWTRSTARGCIKETCCNMLSEPVGLFDDGDSFVAIGDARCGGDESRLCCELPAYGEFVVVTGTLMPPYSMRWWTLANPQICIAAESQP